MLLYYIINILCDIIVYKSYYSTLHSSMLQYIISRAFCVPRSSRANAYYVFIYEPTTNIRTKSKSLLRAFELAQQTETAACPTEIACRHPT